MLTEGFPISIFERRLIEILRQKPVELCFPDSENKYFADINTVNGAIGNAGMNQIMDAEAMETMPGFQLESMSIISLNERAVLQVEGWFHGPNMKHSKYFQGIFIDGSPKEETIKMEEFFLEAQEKDIFEQYRPFFEKSLQSIVWKERI